MFTTSKGSVPGAIMVIIMFAVVLMGVIMIISDYESSRSDFVNATNGTIDPTGGVLTGAGHARTEVITTALVGIGANLIWLFIIAAFVVLFFGVVYFYLKR